MESEKLATKIILGLVNSLCVFDSNDNCLHVDMSSKDIRLLSEELIKLVDERVKEVNDGKKK